MTVNATVYAPAVVTGDRNSSAIVDATPSSLIDSTPLTHRETGAAVIAPVWRQGVDGTSNVQSGRLRQNVSS